MAIQFIPETVFFASYFKSKGYYFKGDRLWPLAVLVYYLLDLHEILLVKQKHEIPACTWKTLAELNELNFHQMAEDTPDTPTDQLQQQQLLWVVC